MGNAEYMGIAVPSQPFGRQQVEKLPT